MLRTAKIMGQLTYASLLVLTACVFVSFSLTALSHILIVVPAGYFAYLAWAQPGVRQGFLRKKSFWALIAFSAICIISVLLNLPTMERPTFHLFKTKYYWLGIGAIFAYQAWLNHYSQEKNIRLLLKVFVIASSIASTSGLVALWTGFNPLRWKTACHLERTCGMYGMYMTYAYGILLVVVLLIGMLLHYRQWSKWINPKLLAIALLINTLGLYLSYARGTYLALVAALFFYLLRYPRKIFLTTSMLIGVLVIGSYLLVPKIQEIFQAPDRLASNQIRLSQWQTAIKAWELSPWFGVGFKNFEPQVKKLKAQWNLPHPEFAGHGHSNIFEHLASTGMLGVLALVLFHCLWAWELYRRQDMVAFVLLPVVVAWFVSGLFQYNMGDGENLFLLMLLYACSVLQLPTATPSLPQG